MPPITRSQLRANSNTTPYSFDNANATPPPAAPANYKDDVCDQPLDVRLRSVQVVSKWIEDPGRRFVPSKKLEELVTREAVKSELHASSSKFTRRGLNKILRAVCGSAGDPQRATTRRLFAILTLIGEAARIAAVIDEGVTDHHLPLLLDARGAQSSLYRESSRGVRVVCKSLADLPAKDQEAFVQSQYTIHVPTFRLSPPGATEIQHLTLEWSMALPFVSDEDAAEDEDGVGALFAVPSGFGDGESAASSGTRTGGFSEVRKIRIHPQQYNCHDFPTSESGNNCFALKILRADTRRETFERENTSLKRLMLEPHANIVCLLGTMERKSHHRPSRYYLIFPWADANLHDFITRKHKHADSPPRDVRLARWMARQMLGLAEALKLVHRCEAGLAVDKKTHGRHGDIKPQNILWYRGSAPGEDDMGTLKLADFGAAEFHSEHSVNVEANLAQHSPTHRAPEHDTSATVSPRVDVWSLGAVLLELLVWYMCGHQGWQDFSEARSREDDGVHVFVGRMVKLDKYFNVVRREGVITGACVKESVHKKISDLRHHKLCSQYFSSVLDMIEKQMLITSFKDRISCRDLVQRFQALNDKCQDSESFCTQPHHRRTTPTPSSSSAPRTPEARPALPATESNASSFLSQPSAGVWSATRFSPTPIGLRTPQTPMTSRENTQELDGSFALPAGGADRAARAPLKKSDSVPEDGGRRTGACLGPPHEFPRPQRDVASRSSLRNELGVDGCWSSGSGRKRTNRERFEAEAQPRKHVKRVTSL